MTPFGFNAGETDPDRGSAFFTDFYDLSPFAATNAALATGVCGVVATTTTAATVLTTKKEFQVSNDVTASCAFRTKQDVLTASDYMVGGFASGTQAGLRGGATASAVFSIGADSAGATQIMCSSMDGTNAITNTDVTTKLVTGFVATDYHTYGIELSVSGTGVGMTGQIHWYVDGKLVNSRSLAYATISATDFEDLTIRFHFEDAALDVPIHTIDWASASGPRV